MCVSIPFPNTKDPYVVLKKAYQDQRARAERAAGMRDALDGMVKEEKAGPTVFARTGDNAGGAVPEKNHLFEIKEYFADKAD